MSRQKLLGLLWHESLAQPLTSWASGRRDHSRLMYGRPASRPLTGCSATTLRNPFHGVICPVGGVAALYDRRK